MPKKQKSLPKVVQELWVIFDPETGFYYKGISQSRYGGEWKRAPFIYTSEKKLMTGISLLSKDARLPKMDPVVVPFNIEEFSSLPCKGYGE